MSIFLLCLKVIFHSLFFFSSFSPHLPLSFSFPFPFPFPFSFLFPFLFLLSLQKGGPEMKKFEKIIFDFKYLKQTDYFEGVIEDSTEVFFSILKIKNKTKTQTEKHKQKSSKKKKKKKKKNSFPSPPLSFLLSPKAPRPRPRLQRTKLRAFASILFVI